MKRLVTVVTLAILLAGLVLFGSGDTVISVADTSVPDGEVASSQSSNISSGASIRITMTGVVDG